ncbi:hypothetical protein LshimejAT787_0500320 [Lyophyllum shimeji]|uniref:Secreted protein n=1 Tax=Lyophyllum shimeji TaxID=47721 RepID=A0A9P3PKV6_LYOSH|nr:hypothetical protein LshimejAT787_0500320 [Lyophyllum shimeji]
MKAWLLACIAVLLIILFLCALQNLRRATNSAAAILCPVAADKSTLASAMNTPPCNDRQPPHWAPVVAFCPTPSVIPVVPLLLTTYAHLELSMFHPFIVWRSTMKPPNHEIPNRFDLSLFAHSRLYRHPAFPFPPSLALAL